MNVVAIIPAFNEEKTIGDVIESTKSFVDKIIVVNDGSDDRTQQIAKSKGAYVVTHVINRGLGAAIGTGFEVALRERAAIAVTLDADGQHDPNEIQKFIDAIEQGADVVIGSRMLTRKGMPWHRQVANLLGNFVTFFLFGAWVSDSQSGFRAFSNYALEKIQIQTNRMEVSSEIIAESKHKNLKLVEVPIKAIYTDYSLSKGQGFFVGIKTLIKLVVRRITQ